MKYTLTTNNPLYTDDNQGDISWFTGCDCPWEKKGEFFTTQPGVHIDCWDDLIEVYHEGYVFFLEYVSQQGVKFYDFRAREVKIMHVTLHALPVGMCFMKRYVAHDKDGGRRLIGLGL